MAKTYYDSAYTGPEIDAAVSVAKAIADSAVPENSGKFLGFAKDGSVQAVDAPRGYDDTALSQRVTDLEKAISGLLEKYEVVIE